MRRRRRAVLAVAAAALLGALAAGGVVGYVALIYPNGRGPGRGRELALDVPWGEGPAGIAERAARAGAIRRPAVFAIYLRASGLGSRLKAGRHVVRDDWPPARVALALTEPGAAEQVRVTLREGATRFDLAVELDRLGVAARAAVLAATERRPLLRRLGIEGPSAEGYLFPETYQIEPGTDPEAIVERLVTTFDRRTAGLFGEHRDALASLASLAAASPSPLPRGEGQGEGPLPRGEGQGEGPGRHVAVTLASMIEAETARTDERPMVAAVMLNRLRSPAFPSRRLQIDPTVAYGCEAAPQAAPSCRGWGPGHLLTTRHLADGANPYNTYLRPGLPPGPIGNPSLDSLAAALSPAPVSYLYFVARGDGGHVFSETLEQHTKAVEQYRRLQDGRRAGAGP